MKDAGRYQVDDLQIDTGTRRVTRAGVDLGIAGLSFDLLLALVRAAPNLVSIDELLQRVWPGVIVGPETLTQRVKLLRQGLGDSADTPRYLGAVRGHGYRMLAAVTELAEPPASGSRRPWLAISVAIALPIAAIAWMGWRSLPHRAAPATESLGAHAPAQRSSAVASKTSVAVLPFTNLTGEPAKEYLGDGMAEELINELSQVRGLQVPARTSTFAYKGRPTDIRRIAQDLSVATILEGSVRSAGERLRISARLVDAASGFQIWSQDYDRQSTDIFKVQDDVAAQVVQALRTHLNVELAAANPRTAPTQDVEAYELYLRGQASANGSPEGFLRGVALYDAALTRDQKFARALEGRSDMQMALVAIGHPLPQGLDGAERDAEQALSLDPKLATAYAVLGGIQSLRNDWQQAESSFRAAIAADPNDGYLRSQHAAFVLSSTGRVRQAYAEATQGYRLAPANGFCAVVLVLVNALKGAGGDEDMVRFADLAIHLGAAPQQFAPFYAQAAARQGRYEEAGNRVADALSPAVRSAGGAEALKLAYAALGDPGRKPAARQALSGLVHKLDSTELTPLFGPELMYLFTLLDGRDEAFELMKRVEAQTISNGWALVFWAPDMRPFRQDPRFLPLAQRLKLVEYWKQYGPPDECDLQDSVLACR